MGPESTVLSFNTGLLAGIADVGAREPGAEQRDPFDLLPVDGSDVAEVWHGRMTVGEQLHRRRMVIRYPGEFAAEHCASSAVEPAIAGEQ